MTVSLETIAAKLRASRPIYNMRGEPIKLTNQHRCVVRYLCRHGFTYKEIARSTGESLNAIKHIGAQPLRLSGCRNQGQLGVWAERQGLL